MILGKITLYVEMIFADSKIPTKREKIFRKTFEKMEGFRFVTPVTGLNRPNTGKEDDNDDDICCNS
jgi:hypothetical protein